MNSRFTKFLIKAFSLLMSLYYFFGGTAVTPQTTDPIKPLNSYNVKLHAVVWADPQVSNYKPDRMPYFEAACEDLKNSPKKLDALLIAGDIAENGLYCEYKMVFDGVKNDKIKNYLMVTGNHDIRMRIYKDDVYRFTTFTNGLNEHAKSDLHIDELHYSYKVNGYTFIVLGSDRSEFEEGWFIDSQLKWLDSEIKEASKSGKPVFVINHQPLKLTHGLPDTWGSPIESAGSVGKQSDKLYEIMNKYEDVIFITGHLHTGYGEYTYEKIGNFHSINLPSLTIKNENGDCNDRGIGYMMEVYSGKVIFRARNFAQGKYVPEYDITIKY
ncbi:MAG: metallophosphoesterase [Clostridia bacterium]|nr:metallophosphoesterase [Clostridia bacterium]